MKYIEYDLNQTSSIIIENDITNVRIFKTDNTIEWTGNISVLDTRTTRIQVEIDNVGTIKGSIDIAKNGKDNYLNFSGVNQITSTDSTKAAIHVGVGSKIEISANVTDYENNTNNPVITLTTVDGAGIGGNSGEGAGSIIIRSTGTKDYYSIFNISSINGAGIGGGYGGAGGLISIFGAVKIYTNSSNGKDIGEGLDAIDRGYLMIAEIKNVKKNETTDLNIQSELMTMHFKESTNSVYAGTVYLFDTINIDIQIYGRTNKSGELFIRLTAGRTIYFKDTVSIGWCESDRFTYQGGGTHTPIFHYVRAIWVTEIGKITSELSGLDFVGADRVFVYLENATDINKNHEIVIPNFIFQIVFIGEVVKSNKTYSININTGNKKYLLRNPIYGLRTGMIYMGIENLTLAPINTNDKVFINIDTQVYGNRLFYFGYNEINASEGEAAVHIGNVDSNLLKTNPGNNRLLIYSPKTLTKLVCCGGAGAAGIGGMIGETVGEITISGLGEIQASGKGGGAGIGGGSKSLGGEISIYSVVTVFAKSDTGEDIGHGFGGGETSILIAEMNLIKRIKESSDNDYQDINTCAEFIPLKFQDPNGLMYGGFVYLYKKESSTTENLIMSSKTNQSGNCHIHAPTGDYFFEFLPDILTQNPQIVTFNGSTAEQTITFSELNIIRLDLLSNFNSELSKVADTDKWIYVYLENVTDRMAYTSLTIPNNIKKVAVVGQVVDTKQRYNACLVSTSDRSDAVSVIIENLTLASQLDNGAYIDIAKNTAQNELYFQEYNSIISYNSKACIHIGAGTSLLISSFDKISNLVCNANYGTGAAIGGNRGESGGNISIGGSSLIYAIANGNRSQSANGGAAIGGGYNGSGGTIRIFDEVKLSAEVSQNGAAIGSGKNDTTGRISGGDIEIYGNCGIVVKSMNNGAGIGGGSNADGGHIKIYGNTSVMALGHNDNDSEIIKAAGIGGGWKGDGGTIEIYGHSSVKAINSRDGAAIGGGSSGDLKGVTPYGSGGTILIYDSADVIATNEYNACAIGGGWKGNAGNIKIYGSSTVQALAAANLGPNVASNPENFGNAAIGAATGRTHGSIEIYDDALVIATSDKGAAIGIGKKGVDGIAGEETNQMTIKIYGNADVTAIGDGGAGIGGGEDREGGTIRIYEHASVDAKSNGRTVASILKQGAGIGGGYNGACGDIQITGDGAIAVSGNPNDIGYGKDYEGTFENCRVFMLNSNDASSMSKPINPKVEIRYKSGALYVGPLLIRTIETGIETGIETDYHISSNKEGKISFYGNYDVTAEVDGNPITRSQVANIRRDSVPTVIYLEMPPVRGINLF